MSKKLDLKSFLGMELVKLMHKTQDRKTTIENIITCFEKEKYINKNPELKHAKMWEKLLNKLEKNKINGKAIGATIVLYWMQQIIEACKK